MLQFIKRCGVLYQGQLMRLSSGVLDLQCMGNARSSSGGFDIFSSLI